MWRFFFAKLFSLRLLCQRKKRVLKLNSCNVGSSFYIRLFLIVFRFSFDTRGAKEKLTKENATGYFAACARRPTLRALDRRKPLKRLDRNFLTLRAVPWRHTDKLQFVTIPFG
jgi:hypothetical protein